MRPKWRRGEGCRMGTPARPALVLKSGRARVPILHSRRERSRPSLAVLKFAMIRGEEQPLAANSCPPLSLDAHLQCDTSLQATSGCSSQRQCSWGRLRRTGNTTVGFSELALNSLIRFTSFAYWLLSRSAGFICSELGDPTDRLNLSHAGPLANPWRPMSQRNDEAPPGCDAFFSLSRCC